ncbi:MAG: DUF3795 domain-containing protein [Lachnospiraceae bacterium]|nr:DUF3795 domain-containing protein [Lachnospiraceae bacterium]
MENSYCGKDCDDCLDREAVGCPGCKSGPGKEDGTLCEIARCCSNKYKNFCEVCDSNGSCAMLANRENMMQKWNGSRKRETAEPAAMSGVAGAVSGTYAEPRTNIARDNHDAPFVRSHLIAIFWLFLLAGFGNVLSNENVFGSFSVVIGLGTVMNIGASIATAILMIRLGREESTFKTAGICDLVATGLMFVAELVLAGALVAMEFSGLAAGGIGAILAILMLLAAVVLEIIAGYKFLVACGRIVERRDLALANRWHVMSKLFFWIFGGIIILLILLLIMPGIALILTILFALGVLAFGVCEYVFLYQTANRFRI